MAHGYTGPKRRPENPTATELPITDGTNHMRSSSINAWQNQYVVICGDASHLLPG